MSRPKRRTPRLVNTRYGKLYPLWVRSILRVQHATHLVLVLTNASALHGVQESTDGILSTHWIHIFDIVVAMVLQSFLHEVAVIRSSRLPISDILMV